MALTEGHSCHNSTSKLEDSSISADIFLTALRPEGTSLPPIAHPLPNGVTVVVPSQPFVSDSATSSSSDLKRPKEAVPDHGTTEYTRNRSGYRVRENTCISNGTERDHDTPGTRQPTRLPPTKKGNVPARLRLTNGTVSRSQSFTARDNPRYHQVESSDDTFSELSQDRESMSLYSAHSRWDGFNHGARGATAAPCPERRSEFPTIAERLVHTSIDVLSHDREQFPALNKAQGNSDDVYYTPYRFQLKSNPTKGVVRSSSMRTTPSISTKNSKTDLRTFQRNNRAKLKDNTHRPPEYDMVRTSRYEPSTDRSPDRTWPRQPTSNDISPRPDTSFNSPRMKRGVSCTKNRADAGHDDCVFQSFRSAKSSGLDITDPIDYIHKHKGGCSESFNDSKSPKLKVRFAKQNVSSFGKENVKIKPSVLRKLNSILKNKAPWKRLHQVADYEDDANDVDEIKFVHLGYSDHNPNDPSKLKGKKVQRGSFITKHSKWTALMQSSEEREDYPTVIKLERESTGHQNNETHNPVTEIPNQLGGSHLFQTLSRPVRPPEPEQNPGVDRVAPGKDVYRVVLSDKTVLLIDHKKKRDVMSAESNEGLQSAKINGQVHHPDAPSVEETSRANSRNWAPPNTPLYEEPRRPYFPDYSGAHEIDQFQIIDDAGRTVSRMYSINEEGNKFTFEHTLT